MSSKEKKNDFYVFKAMILGNDGVGKTTMFYKYMGEDRKTYLCNVGYKDYVGIGGKRMVKMEITDIPESEVLRHWNTGIWHHKAAIFIMFDVTDETSFLIGKDRYNGGVN